MELCVYNGGIGKQHFSTITRRNRKINKGIGKLLRYFIFIGIYTATTTYYHAMCTSGRGNPSGNGFSSNVCIIIESRIPDGWVADGRRRRPSKRTFPVRGKREKLIQKY